LIGSATSNHPPLFRDRVKQCLSTSQRVVAAQFRSVVEDTVKDYKFEIISFDNLTFELSNMLTGCSRGSASSLQAQPHHPFTKGGIAGFQAMVLTKLPGTPRNTSGEPNVTRMELYHSLSCSPISLPVACKRRCPSLLTAIIGLDGGSRAVNVMVEIRFRDRDTLDRPVRTAGSHSLVYMIRMPSRTKLSQAHT